MDRARHQLHAPSLYYLLYRHMLNQRLHAFEMEERFLSLKNDAVAKKIQHSQAARARAKTRIFILLMDPAPTEVVVLPPGPHILSHVIRMRSQMQDRVLRRLQVGGAVPTEERCWGGNLRACLISRLWQRLLMQKQISMLQQSLIDS